MAKPVLVTSKKKRGRPATGRDPHVTARLPQDLIDGIERWADLNGVSRSEAIRRLIELSLKSKSK
jgi:Arc/MetJ-type ribon-helix-helix transcriptional regulator